MPSPSPPPGRAVLPRSLATRLTRLRAWWVGHAVLHTLLRMAAVSAVLLAASFLVDWSLDLSLSARRAAAVIGLATWIAVGVGEWLRVWRRTPSREALAKRLEARWPAARGLLVSAYEWRMAPVDTMTGERLWRGVSLELIAEVRRQADEVTRETGFRGLFPELSTGRLAGWVAAVAGIVGLGVLAVAGTELGRVWFARNGRFATVDYPRRTEVAVENLLDGKLIVPRGGVAEAVIRVARRDALAGVPPQPQSGASKSTEALNPLPAPEVAFRPARTHSLRPISGRALAAATTGAPTAAITSTTVSATAGGATAGGATAGGAAGVEAAAWHRLAVRDVLEPFSFQVRADDARTAWIAVELVDPPRLLSLELTVTEPAYAGGATVILPPGQGPYRVLRGSTLSFVGQVSTPLGAARLLTGQREHALTLDMSADRTAKAAVGAATGTFRGSLSASDMTEGLLSFSVRDKHGLDFPRPPSVRLEWQEDAPPSVSVVWTGASRLVVPGGALASQVDVRDDRQVAGLRLLARVAAPGGEKVDQPWTPWPRTVSSPTVWPVAGSASVHESLRWDSARAPVGSIVTFVYEATDNDTVSGPKSTRSAEKSLRVVEPDELRADWLRREKETRQLIEQLVDDLVAWGEQAAAVPAAVPVEVAAPGAAVAAGERNQERKRDLERDLERYASYRLAVAEHHAGLTAIWQEMRYSGLEPSTGKLSASDRLAERVLEPLVEVRERRMPAVIEAVRAGQAESEVASRHALVVDGLRMIARELSRAEGFQEAVRLVEELQDGQRAVLVETLEAERRRVRELLDRPNK